MSRLLLDTHALLWWLAGDGRLTPVARDAIASPTNDIFVSAATAWEITTKHRLGKLPGAAAIAPDIFGCLVAEGFDALAITLPDAEEGGRLPGPHRDPFDRLLVAQALGGDLTLISNEKVFDAYGVRRLW